MGIVTVDASHPAVVHPALEEGAVDVDLLEHLSVGVVEVLAKRHRHEVVQEGTTGAVLAAHQVSPGMAGRADVDFVARVPGLEVHQQPVVSGGGDAQPLRLLGPLDVRLPRPVAGLAGDVDLVPGGGVAVGIGVVALHQIGRVALGAHRVPDLVAPRPVERIAGGDPLVRVEVEPAPAALFRGPGVPGDSERLQAPAGKPDQILLQVLDAEGVEDLVLGGLPVRPLGLDEEPAIPLVEAGRDAELCEHRVVEIPQDGVFAGHLHGQIVMGAGPGLVRFLVALDTGGAPCEAGAPLPAGSQARRSVELRGLLFGAARQERGEGRRQQQDPVRGMTHQLPFLAAASQPEIRWPPRIQCGFNLFPRPDDGPPNGSIRVLGSPGSWTPIGR